MRMIVTTLAALVAGIVWGGAARAQSQGEIEACVTATAPDAREGCIGIFASRCLDTQAGMSTQGQVACMEDETRLWDRLLNRDYRRLMALLDDEQQAALRTAERAWIALRDADCAFPHVLVRGTMSQPWAASCRLDMTARRVLWLRDQLEFLGVTR